MKLYYVVNARLPNKKAYGIQIAKMCEAFIEAGVDLTLVIPRTRAARSRSMRGFYDLRVDVPTVMLPNVDWYASGTVPFLISSFIFLVESLAFLFFKFVRGERGIVYSIDMDSFSFAPLPLAPFPVVAEMHDVKGSDVLNRFFFRRAALIIATNREIADRLRATFHLPETSIITEPNGVDIALFENMPQKKEARSQLNIPLDQKIALYLGRFYEWKGLDVLIEAAREESAIDWYIAGGGKQEFMRVTKQDMLSANLHVVGEVPFRETPTWLAAADVLLILGTKKNERSWRGTSPMKVFEYMAARRPIVAARTPALESILSESAAYFYEPDNAQDLAARVRGAIGDPREEMRAAGERLALAHTWEKRAHRIKNAIVPAI